MSSDECKGHEWKADKNMKGQPSFRHRRFASEPVVRAHCVHCKYTRYFSVAEWSDASKAD